MLKLFAMKDYFNSSVPTFGKFSSLLNEQVSTDVNAMNEWHFQNFFKRCLIDNGFISILRHINDGTLYIKLYYYEKKIKNNKREIEQFVASYYRHEKYELNYKDCNIIRIPLKTQLDKNAIQQQNDIQSLERFLQQQLNDNSWVGIDFSGTKGGLTMCSSSDYSIHQRHKKLLDEGYLDEDYESRVSAWLEEKKIQKRPVRTRIKRQSDGLRISVSPDEIVISWDNALKGMGVSYTIEFYWKGIHVKLTASEYNGTKSRTIQAMVECLDQTYTFGIGQCSLGAGYTGSRPRISSGNNKLVFDIGLNCVSFSDIVINQTLELMEEKRESNFQLIL
jgi:hypothetical protein